MASAETPVSAKTGSGGSPQKKFGLVLQGCAALGAYEAGAIKCLYGRGMECTIVAGASSGALNAVKLAAAKNPPDDVEKMWREFASDAELPPLVPIKLEVPHMYSARMDYWALPAWTYGAYNTPLKEMLEGLDWDQVRDPDHMRVFVSASDIENGKTVYFSNIPPGRLPPGQPEYLDGHFGVQHVLASGSFPGGYPWTVIDGRTYWDGGATDNTPIHPVIDNLTKAEAETLPIYVIDVFTGAGSKPTNLLEVELRFFELLLQNNLETDTKRAQRYARFISLLKDVNKILVQKDAKRILDEVKKLPAAPSGLEDLLEDLLRVKRKKDWGDVMKYDHVQNVHAVDIKKPAEDNPAEYTKQTIERRLQQGCEQMCQYLDSPSSATSG